LPEVPIFCGEDVEELKKKLVWDRNEKVTGSRALGREEERG
jgi:hypothetical protein